MTVEMGERRARIAQERLTIKDNRGQAFWNTFLGSLLTGALGAAFGYLWTSVGGLPSQMILQVGIFWFFLMIPGLVYLTLGIWYFRKMRRVEEVIAPQRLKDYGPILAQLSPGIALSALGIWLGKEYPGLTAAIHPVPFDWLVLLLATLVSLIVVRRTRDKV
jgi:hypothetical protein